MGVVNTAYTFDPTDVITSAKMNNIIDETTFTGTAVLGTTLEVSSGQLKIASAGITSNELSAGAVNTNALASNAVTTVKIADSTGAADGVTTAKLATGAVTSPKIADGGVATVNIADAGVTAAKLSGAQTGSAPILGARAYGTITSTGTAFESGSKNVASVVKNSTGNYTVTFTTAMPSSTYVVMTNPIYTAGGYYFAAIAARTSTTFTIACAYRDPSGDRSLIDMDVSFVVFS